MSCTFTYIDLQNQLMEKSGGWDSLFVKLYWNKFEYDDIEKFSSFRVYETGVFK